jgi:sugar transferase (PEP-CTERM/EpsH1 system associated)
MKVLFCTPRLPFPPLKGDQAVSYHRARVLSQKHELHLLSFYQDTKELESLPQLGQIFASVTPVRLSRFRSLANMGVSLFRPSLPLQVGYYRSAQFARELSRLEQTHNFDLLHVFLLRLAPYLPKVSKPKLVELIDSMELNLERRANEAIGLKRWVLQEELRRIRSYEGAAVRTFDAATVVSERDASVLREPRVQVISLGVDVSVYSPAEQTATGSSIIFSGNLSYEPNITAVQWFMDNCYTALRQRVPEIKFTVAGANPSKEIARLANEPGVEVTGYVPSMVDALRGAKVAVAPMQTGSGMQFKILEAMATGLPVVTTSFGLGSIQARGEVELEVADAPSAFVDKVAGLLGDAEKRRKMGAAARQFVMDRHSWEEAGRKIDQIYASLARAEFRS